jgi:protein TonB
MSHHWASPVFVGALLLSSSVHAVPVVQAIRDLFELRTFIQDARTDIHEFLWTSYDVEVEREKPPELQQKPEEPTPDVAPIVIPKVNTPKPSDKPAETRPSTAAAAQTLTAKEDPSQPVDFTDFTMAQGNADKYYGGVTSADGKAKGEVTDPNARGSGTPGGKGSADASPAAAPKQEGPDLSKPASVARKDWKCPFPPEADADDVDHANVRVLVTIRPDGTPASVKVLNDPGHGFGRQARNCALGERYNPALDRDGKPTQGTASVGIDFTR